MKAHNFFHCMSFMIHVIMSSELLCSLPFLNMLGIELVEYFYWSKFRKKKGSCYLTLISILILNHITFKKIYISFNFKSNCFQPNFCEQNWSQNILYKSFQQHIVKYLSMNLTNKSKMNHNYFAIF